MSFGSWNENKLGTDTDDVFESHHKSLKDTPINKVPTKFNFCTVPVTKFNIRYQHLIILLFTILIADM